MLLDEIGTFLAAGGIGLSLFAEPADGGAPTGNLMLGKMLDQPDDITTVYETPGTPPTYTMGGPAKPLLELPRLQIMCRSKVYENARDLAEKIYQLLGAVAGNSLSGVRYLSISPLQEPYLFDRDANQRVLIACNYEIDKELSTP